MSYIYVASSWRNNRQPYIVEQLELDGHEVYDFRNPPGGVSGFHWSDIDENWKEWDAATYRHELLTHDLCEQGFRSDFDAMLACDTFVLLLPCGRSAHLEMGWAIGMKRRTAILLDNNDIEPELMYRMADRVLLNVEQLKEWA